MYLVEPTPVKLIIIIIIIYVYLLIHFLSFFFCINWVRNKFQESSYVYREIYTIGTNVL